MDLILTGREVAPDEAHAIGLANYLTPDETALPRALKLAEDIAAFPQALHADGPHLGP
jgi:enoyl-CoA hydratase